MARNADLLSPDDVLALLSPAQRATFQQTLQDPSKVSALVSAEFQDEPPWWIKSEKARDVPEDSDEDSGDDEQESLPPILGDDQLPPLKTGPDGKILGHQLVYNIAAVLLVPSVSCRVL